MRKSVIAQESVIAQKSVIAQADAQKSVIAQCLGSGQLSQNSVRIGNF
jgi:hypothetical protein